MDKTPTQCLFICFKKHLHNPQNCYSFHHTIMHDNIITFNSLSIPLCSRLYLDIN